jgi:hypothetical protein
MMNPTVGGEEKTVLMRSLNCTLHKTGQFSSEKFSASIPFQLI